MYVWYAVCVTLASIYNFSVKVNVNANGKNQQAATRSIAFALIAIISQWGYLARTPATPPFGSTSPTSCNGPNPNEFWPLINSDIAVAFGPRTRLLGGWLWALLQFAFACFAFCISWCLISQLKTKSRHQSISGVHFSWFLFLKSLFDFSQFTQNFHHIFINYTLINW